MNTLRTGAENLGLTLSEQQVGQFQTYYELMVDWNSRINLTAITDYELVQVRHFLDSLTLAVALYQLEMCSVSQISMGQPPDVLKERGRGIIDLGTGAGFPGLPLKILWPGVKLTLVDSVGKKVNFLKEVVGALGLLNVDAIKGRAEELGQDRAYRGQYDLVTARAVATLPVLAEYGLPLARVGGVMLAPKKGDIGAELQQAQRAVTKLGGRSVQSLPFTLPGDVAPREVVAMPKVAPTPAIYPRHVGVPDKSPLGVE